MHEWIALDGVKSTTIPGLAVLAYTPPLLAPRSREETVIAGRLTALTQRDWQREPADLEITLGAGGRKHGRPCWRCGKRRRCPGSMTPRAWSWTPCRAISFAAR